MRQARERDGAEAEDGRERPRAPAVTDREPGHDRRRSPQGGELAKEPRGAQERADHHASVRTTISNEHESSELQRNGEGIRRDPEGGHHPQPGRDEYRYEGEGREGGAVEGSQGSVQDGGQEEEGQVGRQFAREQLIVNEQGAGRLEKDRDRHHAGTPERAPVEEGWIQDAVRGGCAKSHLRTLPPPHHEPIACMHGCDDAPADHDSSDDDDEHEARKGAAAHRTWRGGGRPTRSSAGVGGRLDGAHGGGGRPGRMSWEASPRPPPSGGGRWGGGGG